MLTLMLFFSSNSRSTVFTYRIKWIIIGCLKLTDEIIPVILCHKTIIFSRHKNVLLSMLFMVSHTWQMRLYCDRLIEPKFIGLLESVGVQRSIIYQLCLANATDGGLIRRLLKIIQHFSYKKLPVLFDLHTGR